MLLEIESDNYLYLFRAGLLHAWTGRVRPRRGTPERTLRSKPRRPGCRNSTDSGYQLANRFEEALNMTETLLSQSPFNENLRALQVQLTFWNGAAPGKANRMADALLQDFPNNTNSPHRSEASIRQSIAAAFHNFVRPPTLGC